MLKKEKEEIMTNVLTDIRDFIETEEVKVDYPTPKLDTIIDFFVLKSFAKKSKSKINEYTKRDKNIRNGQAVLAGTRITTKEIMSIIAESTKEPDALEYILEQYPSIDNKDKILYGALYEIKKKNTFLFILGVLFSK